MNMPTTIETFVDPETLNFTNLNDVVPAPIRYKNLKPAGQQFVVTDICFTKTGRKCEVTFLTAKDCKDLIEACSSRGPFTYKVVDCSTVDGKVLLLTKLALAELKASVKSKLYVNIFARATEHPNEAAFDMIAKIGLPHFCRLASATTASMFKLLGTVSLLTPASQARAGKVLNRLLTAITLDDIILWCKHKEMAPKRVHELLSRFAVHVHLGQAQLLHEIEDRNHLAALTLYGLLPPAGKEQSAVLEAFADAIPHVDDAVVASVLWRAHSTTPRPVMRAIFKRIVATVAKFKANPEETRYYQAPAWTKLAQEFMSNPANRAYVAAVHERLPDKDVSLLVNAFVAEFTFRSREHYRDEAMMFAHFWLTFAATRGFVQKYLRPQDVSCYAIAKAISTCPDELLEHVLASAAGTTINSAGQLQQIAKANGGVLVTVPGAEDALGHPLAATLGQTVRTPVWTEGSATRGGNLKWHAFKNCRNVFLVMPLALPSWQKTDCSTVSPERFTKLVQLMLLGSYKYCHHSWPADSAPFVDANGVATTKGIATYLTAHAKLPYLVRASMGGLMALYFRLLAGCPDFALSLFLRTTTTQDRIDESQQKQTYTSPAQKPFAEEELVHYFFNHPECIPEITPPLMQSSTHEHTVGSYKTLVWNAALIAERKTKPCPFAYSLRTDAVLRPDTLMKSDQATHLIKITAWRAVYIHLWGVQLDPARRTLSWMCEDVMFLILHEFVSAEKCPASMTKQVVEQAVDAFRSFPFIVSARADAQKLH